MLDCIVDVSHWQRPQDCHWTAAIGAGILGLIVKVSQGTGYVDPAAHEHIARARQANLPLLGAYHFLDGSNGVDQADHFVETVGTVFGVGEEEPFTNILLAMDWERNTGPGGQATPRQAYDFVSALDDYGYRPVLYGNPVKSLGYAFHDIDPIVQHLDLWLPKYGPEPDDHSAPGWPRSRIKLWQHTDGHVGFKPGPTTGLGVVDRSIWFGTEPELREWWAANGAGE